MNDARLPRSPAIEGDEAMSTEANTWPADMKLLDLALIALDRVGEDGALQWMKENIPGSNVISLGIHEALAEALNDRQPKGKLHS
jgi:hypothetical protein